jgi:hypothetical protein
LEERTHKLIENFLQTTSVSAREGHKFKSMRKAMDENPTVS